MALPTLPPEGLTLLGLAGAAFFAGTVDAISGGGGLITLPALLAGGIDPVSAVATSKIQSCVGSGGSLLAFARKGHVQFRTSTPAAALGFAGALGGAMLLQRFAPAFPVKGIPVLLIVAAGFFAITDLGEGRPDRSARPLLLGAVVFTVGAYDGFLGPGAGAFFVMASLAAGGVGLLGAIAHAKYFNVMSNMAALAVYIPAGEVQWKVGLLMAVASLAGGQLGTHLATRFQARIARPLLVLISIALALKLLLP